jgi:hypothetical protein
MVVDLVGKSRDEVRTPARRPAGLRILDVAQPMAYCLPGVRSRVVVSEGTLTSLSEDEVSRSSAQSGPTCAPGTTWCWRCHRGARRVPSGSSAAPARSTR